MTDRKTPKDSPKPRFPKHGWDTPDPTDDEENRTRSLDFNKREYVDWSGYYTDGESAPDYE